MSELVIPPAPQESRPVRFFSTGDSYEELVRDLDGALDKGNLPVADVLSPLLMEFEERRGMSMSLAKAYLKNRALPVFDTLQIRQRGREIDEQTAQQLDEVYEDTAEHIAVLMSERKSLPLQSSEYYRHIKHELTGGITELAIFALLNRNGRYSNFIATPTTRREDEAGFDAIGRNLSIDFNVYPHLQPVTDLHNPVRLQVKSSENTPNQRYSDDILVVALDALTPESSQGFTELPSAIVAEARGTSTSEQRLMVGKTATNLSRTILEHYNTQ